MLFFIGIHAVGESGEHLHRLLAGGLGTYPFESAQSHPYKFAPDPAHGEEGRAVTRQPYAEAGQCLVKYIDLFAFWRLRNFFYTGLCQLYFYKSAHYNFSYMCFR